MGCVLRSQAHQPQDIKSVGAVSWTQVQEGVVLQSRPCHQLGQKVKHTIQNRQVFSGAVDTRGDHIPP